MMPSLHFSAQATVDTSLKQQDPLLARALNNYIARKPEVFSNLPDNITSVRFDIQKRARLMDEFSNTPTPRLKDVPGYTVTREDGEISRGYLDYASIGGHRLFRFLPPVQKRLQRAIDNLVSFADLVSRG